MTRIIVLAAAIAVVAAPSSAAAQGLTDRVELTTGEVFFGRVLRDNDDEVSVQLASGGILSFRQSLVRQVRRRVPPPELEEEETWAGTAELQWPPPRVRLSEIPEPILPPRTSAIPRSDAVATRSYEPGSSVSSTGGPATDGRATPREPPTGDGAKPSDGAATTAPRLPREPVRDHVLGFSVLPPSGFVEEDSPAGSDVVRTFRDPLTQATFVVTAYETDADLIEIKNQVTRTYSSRFEGVKIEQDASLPAANTDGWLVEVRGRLGTIDLHQLQAFVRTGDHVVVLTYATSEALWKHYADSYEDSIRSVRSLDAAATGRSTTRGGIPTVELPDLPPAPAVTPYADTTDAFDR